MRWHLASGVAVAVGLASCISNATRRPFDRLERRFGCNSELRTYEVAQPVLSPHERCILATAALRFWWDSLVPALHLDSSAIGTVSRASLARLEFIVEDLDTLQSLAQSTPSRIESGSSKRDTVWSVRLELPRYARDISVAISQWDSRFSASFVSKRNALPDH